MNETRSGSSESRFGRDQTGQSAPVAVALLLGITLLGTGAVLALGSGAFTDARAVAEHERAEQSMTALDARAADVALGSAPTDRVRLGPSGDGSYAVDGDAGRITVTHRNATPGGDETLYEGRLGAVVYRDDETTVAYQGGGVWRQRDGGTVMVSPPEFHYRSNTLTLPVVNVSGSGGASGDVTAAIDDRDTRRIYPAPNATYGDADAGAPYANPLRNGTVTVTVRSDYYEGWATYFRTRTAGEVTVDHADRSATVELIAPRSGGPFADLHRSKVVPVRGAAPGHAVEEFSVDLRKGNNFNNLYFSFWAETDHQEFEVLVHVPGGLGGKPCKHDGEVDEISSLTMDVYYHDDRTSEGRHAWTNDEIDADSGPIRLHCRAGEVELAAEFTGSTPLTYGHTSTANNQWHHDWEGERVASGVSFEHADEGGHARRFESGETTTSEHAIRHYLGLLGPKFDLVVDYGPGRSPRLDPDASSGVLTYEHGSDARYITYLHVTENGIRVDLD